MIEGKTTAERKKIAKKLVGDFEWACENVYRVVNQNRLDGGLVPFKWNRGQRLLAERILGRWLEGKPVRLILLKSRQFGGSTWIVLFMYWVATTKRVQKALVVAHKKEAAKKLMHIARIAFEQTPPWLRPACRYNTSSELFFDYTKREKRGKGLQSHMLAETAGDLRMAVNAQGKSDFRRGDSMTLLHLSEVAFYPDQDRLTDALLSTVPYTGGTMVVMESTPNMRGDAFWRSCRRAREGKSEFDFAFVPWTWDAACDLGPDNQDLIDKVDMQNLSTREKWLVETHHATQSQIAWRRFKIDSEQFKGDADSFCAEYVEDPESCFLTSGNSVFSGVLDKMELSRTVPSAVGDLVGEPSELVTSKDGKLRVYEYPEDRKRYAVGVDVSEGLRMSSDESTIVVVNEQGRVACVWVGRTTPSELAYEAARVAAWYNRAMMAIERNAAGVATVEKCLDIYPVLFTEMIPDGLGKRKARVGWRTTPASKSLLIARIRQQAWWGAEWDTGVRDEQLLDQLGTFVQHGDGTIGATDGCKDDLVMAYGIALYVLGDVRVTNQVQTVFRVKDAQGRWQSNGADAMKRKLPIAGSGRRWA